jgi:hypothetical protein
MFNMEWYKCQSKGKLGEEHTGAVPDIYLQNMELDDVVLMMRKELARGTWDNHITSTMRLSYNCRTIHVVDTISYVA